VASHHVSHKLLGIGTPGSQGDGSAATEASIWNPFGVSVDNTGNIFIADTSNNIVRKVDYSGIITTFAGKHIIFSFYSSFFLFFLSFSSFSSSVFCSSSLSYYYYYSFVFSSHTLLPQQLFMMLYCYL